MSLVCKWKDYIIHPKQLDCSHFVDSYYTKTNLFFIHCNKKFKIALPHTRVLDWLLSKEDLYLDYLKLKVCFNHKELSEIGGLCKSFSLLHQYLLSDTDPTLTCFIVVADGALPACASLCSLLFKSDSYSIDPKMDPNYKSPISNVNTYSSKIEDWITDNLKSDLNCAKFANYENLVVLSPHAHVGLEQYYFNLKKLFPNLKSVIIGALICCVKQVISDPDLNFIGSVEDFGILSPKRTIKFWVQHPKFQLKESIFDQDFVEKYTKPPKVKKPHKQNTLPKFEDSENYNLQNLFE